MPQLRSKEKHLVRSYLTLRKTVGIIGIGLPFALAFGGLLLGIDLQESISAYYHTEMRDLFVGSLCAIAVFLWSYRGFERRDDIAGNLACIFALGVAFFPTAPGSPEASEFPVIIGRLHTLFTAAFFLTLAYFSLFLFRLSDQETPTEEKLIRNFIYLLCGYAMIACLILIGIVNIPAIAQLVRACKPVFWLEACAILFFGVSWFVKGEAILKDHTVPGATRLVAPRIPI
jgi:hypothetical protein